jgi:hypothetical protein
MNILKLPIGVAQRSVAESVFVGGKPIVFICAVVYLVSLILYVPPNQVGNWDVVLGMLLSPSVVFPMVVSAVGYCLIGPIPSRRQIIYSLVSMILGVCLLFLALYLGGYSGMFVWFFIGIPLSQLAALIVAKKSQTW